MDRRRAPTTDTAFTGLTSCRRISVTGMIAHPRRGKEAHALAAQRVASAAALAAIRACRTRVLQPRLTRCRLVLPPDGGLPCLRCAREAPSLPSGLPRTVACMTDVMPSPPFPDPDSATLRMVIRNSIDAYRSGEVDVEGAILHAAVHGWDEGHIQGEDECPGCDYPLPLVSMKRRVGYDAHLGRGHWLQRSDPTREALHLVRPLDL
jgi:hypothetical protein